MVRGLAAIDQRTAAAQHLVAFRRELLDDLGGAGAVSAAQATLVEVAVRTRLYLDHVDAVLLARESLVVRGRRVLPLLEQRTRLAGSLLEILSKLGLERRARPVEDLETYVTRRYGCGNGHEADEIRQRPQGRRSDAGEEENQAPSVSPLPGAQSAGGAGATHLHSQEPDNGDDDGRNG
jgi:hypothetical protein